MKRAERRRRARGVGLGWRWTPEAPRKRYPVREHTRPVDTAQLERESDEAIERINQQEGA